MFGIYFRSDDGIQKVGSAEEAAHNFNYSSYCDIGEVNDRHHFETPFHSIVLIVFI